MATATKVHQRLKVESIGKGKEQTMKTADLVFDRLKDWGVSMVFGLPGDGINGFIEAQTQWMTTWRMFESPPHVVRRDRPRSNRTQGPRAPSRDAGTGSLSNLARNTPAAAYPACAQAGFTIVRDVARMA